MSRALTPLIFALIALLVGCQGNPAVSATKGGFAPPLRGEVACDSCQVRYFDGNILIDAMLSDGRYTIPVAALPCVLFVSGPGSVPQISFLHTAEPPAPLRLEPQTDPRQGYLAGVVVRSATGGKRGGGHGLEPVADVEVAIVKGRARQVVRSGADGAFQMRLPAGEYRVYVDGRNWDVAVPAADAALLPIVITRMIVD